MKIKHILAIILMLVPLAVTAQQKANVKVTLKDTLSKDPIAFATVSLSKSGQTTPVSYALTASDGVATLDKVAFGEYLFKAELMGYKSVTKTINVDKRTIDLGVIFLEEDAIALEAAKVSAVGNPVVVKQDTIEYNAASFKTSENAVLKDLLAKLPGIEIDKEGNITSNGKEIKKITVNGKTFFLDDPNIASENLPAKIIEKVKVVDKKSDQSAFTGIEDDDKETIIDVSTYKGKYDGWFGNVNAAGGLDLPTTSEKEAGITADPRFSGRAMLGQFSDSWNTFLIANGNNTNTGGFGMRGGMSGFGGGSGNNGISTTWLTAANVGYNGVQNLDLTTSAQYGGNSSYRTNESSRTDFMEGKSDKYSDSASENTSSSESLEFGVDLRYTPEKTRVTFRPTFTFNNQEANSSSSDNSWNDEGTLNDSKSFSYSIGNTTTARGSLMVGQQLGKKGRTISMDVNYNISNSDSESMTYSDTKYYQSEKESVHRDQYSITDSKSRTLGANLQYTEPLVTNLFVSASYSFNYTGSNSYKTTFDYSGDDANHSFSSSLKDKGLYTIENQELSSIVEQKFIRQSAGLSLQYQKDRNFVQIGGEIQPTFNENYTKSSGQESNIPGEWLYNWAPRIRARYTINDNSNINMSYNGRSSQPSVSNLQTIMDISNPTRLTMGNAFLSPTFTHNANLRYFVNNKQTFTSFNVGLNGSYTTNGIVNASWDDANGIRYSIPVNTKKPSANYRGNIMFNSPIAKSNFSVSSHTSASVGFSTSYQTTKTADEDVTNILNAGLDPEEFNYQEFMAWFWGGNNGDRFYSGKSGFAESSTTSYSISENVRMRYNGEIFSGSIGANFRYNSARYSLRPEQNTSTWNNSINADALFSIASLGLELGGDAEYKYYRGYAAGYGDKPETILNLNANKVFGSLSLGISVNDLLNQTQSISRSISENYMQDTRSNVLGRYFLVKLTYNFGKLAGQRGGGMGMRRMGGGFRGPM